MDEDIDYNPFYQALQGRLNDKHQWAQENCYTICIPHSSCITQADVTAKFTEMHILKKSPYFQGAYTTTDLNNSGTLRLESGHLVTAEGFKEVGRRIKVLAEEIGYNSDYKTYRILLLAEPIWTEQADIMGVPRRKSRILRNSVQDPLSVKVSFDDNKQFLESFADHRQALAQLDNHILQFNQNYLILKRYLKDASGRLQGIWQEAADEILDSSKHPLKSDRRYSDVISAAVESYLLGHVHPKILPVVYEACSAENQALNTKLDALRHIKPHQLGVPFELCCPLEAAVMEMDKLEGLPTPHEKLHCLKTMLDVVTESVNSHVNRNQRWGDHEPPTLTSDELIPLIICVIAGCACRRLESEVYYMEEFHWCSPSQDDLSYVTFKAALEYVKSNDICQSFPAAKAGSVSDGSGPSTEEAPASRSQASREEQPRRPSRLDRQMERINKMLASTTIDPTPPPTVTSKKQPSYMRVPSRQPNYDVIHNMRKAQLGDFLSSLQDDSLHSSYGKQT